MVVRRSIERVDISFSTKKCRGERLEDIVATYKPKVKEYKNLSEAERFGTLTEWANRYATLTALAVAAKHIGVEAPTDITITELEATTFCIEEIVGTAINPKQEVTVELPADIIANIEVMLSEMRKNIDNTDYVDQLIIDLDKLLAKYGATRKDIQDLINNEGLGYKLLKEEKEEGKEGKEGKEEGKEE